MNEMKNLLASLKLYRKFPRFQLERHFDVLLMTYIPEIINQLCDTSYDFVIPEFPVSKSSLEQDYRSDMESIAFDYAVFDSITQSAGIVELKTETGSSRTMQDNNLKRLESLSSEDLLKFIDNRANYNIGKKQTRGKYKFLLSYLEQNKRMYRNDNPVRTYKIGPKSTTPANGYILFADVAKKVKVPGDLLWPEICKCLVEWNEPMTAESLEKDRMQITQNST